MSEELKPCPFCGAAPFDHAIEPHTHSPFLKSIGIPDHGGSHVIECGCGAGLIDDTKDAVFARWNARSLSAGASGGGECRVPMRKIAMRHPLQSDEAFALDEANVRGWNACRSLMLSMHAPTSPATGEGRRFRGVGHLEATGYIPEGSAAEREAATPQPESARGVPTWFVSHCPGYPGGIDFRTKGEALDIIRRHGNDETALHYWIHQAGRIDYTPEQTRAMLAAAPHPQQAPAQDGECSCALCDALNATPESRRRVHKLIAKHPELFPHAILATIDTPAHGDGDAVDLYASALEAVAKLPAYARGIRRGQYSTIDMAAISAINSALTARPAPEADARFQDGVSEWMAQCFVPSLYSNMVERGDRLLEEVLELLQAHDYPVERIPSLAKYVWGRPKGEPGQEVGGVMVTLAGFCWIAGLDMHAEGHRELARINQPEVMAKIRAKQEAKNALHFDTPLPGDASQPRGEATGDTTTFAEAWERLTPRDRAIISAYFYEPRRKPSPSLPKHCTCGEGILHSPGEFPWCRAGVAAWLHQDDPARVISAAQKAQALQDGGASASSVAPYTIPLTR